MLKNILKKKPSIFTSYSNQNNYELENFANLQATLELWKQKQKIIQSQFEFNIPNYIIDEIIELEKTKNYSNLHALLLLAVDNNRISVEEANLIEQFYC